MDIQEREKLKAFLQQLTQAQIFQKDGEADALISEACRLQSSAAYLLVQRAMQLEYALQQTQALVSKLQSELEIARAGAGRSFLADANAWGKSPAAGLAEKPSLAAQPVMMSPPGAVRAAPSAPSAWGSGLMGNVATTAAGVVAGSFLFQGIENLMGHHNSGGSFGGGRSEEVASHSQQPTENTTINNYYGSDAAAHPDPEINLSDASDESTGSDDVV